MSTREALLAEIDAFLARPDINMTEATFGLACANDGKLVLRLRKPGGNITINTADAIRDYIAARPPQPAQKDSGEGEKDAA